MSAETLRRAAGLMRERARGATPGPWFAVASGIEGAGTVFHDAHVLHNDATHIASWHPAVARAVADWLEHDADAYEQHRASATTLGLRIAPALAVARAYLGESA